jgi:hypothetical protein
MLNYGIPTNVLAKIDDERESIFTAQLALMLEGPNPQPNPIAGSHIPLNRYYHRTGGECYYGSVGGFKDFLTNFLQFPCPKIRPRVISELALPTPGPSHGQLTGVVDS